MACPGGGKEGSQSSSEPERKKLQRRAKKMEDAPFGVKKKKPVFHPCKK